MVIRNLIILLWDPAYLEFFESNSPISSRTVTQVSTFPTPSVPSLPDSELFLYTPYSRRRKSSAITNEVRIWRGVPGSSHNIGFHGIYDGIVLDFLGTKRDTLCADFPKEFTPGGPPYSAFHSVSIIQPIS
jgi:hypothetical protein